MEICQETIAKVKMIYIIYIPCNTCLCSSAITTLFIRNKLVFQLVPIVICLSLRSPLQMSTSCWAPPGGPGGRDTSPSATTCAPDLVVSLN